MNKVNDHWLDLNFNKTLNRGNRGVILHDDSRIKIWKNI